VTRFRITLLCYQAELAKGAASCVSEAATCPGANREARQHGDSPIVAEASPKNPFSDQRWVPPAKLAEYPLSVTGRKIADLVINSVGKSHAAGRG
jgi:hypothetical protein